jgi:hypothetical protein
MFPGLTDSRRPETQRLFTWVHIRICLGTESEILTGKDVFQL